MHRSATGGWRYFVHCTVQHCLNSQQQKNTSSLRLYNTPSVSADTD